MNRLLQRGINHTKNNFQLHAIFFSMPKDGEFYDYRQFEGNSRE